MQSASEMDMIECEHLHLFASLRLLMSSIAVARPCLHDVPRSDSPEQLGHVHSSGTWIRGVVVVILAMKEA